MSPLADRNAKSLSLRQIAVLAVCVGILLPAILFGVLSLQSRLDDERTFYVETLTNQYADVLAQAAAIPLWNVDVDAVDSLADALMRNQDVVLVRVEELNQGIFSERGDLDQVPEGSTHTVLRTVIHQGEPIGTATIVMNTSNVEARLSRDRLFAIATLAVQVALSIMFVYLALNHRVIRPIEDIKQEAVRLARGELDQPLYWSRDDEIGQLAGGLDVMRQELREVIDEIDLKNMELEQELQERIATEEALRQTEAKFKTLFNASPIAIAVAIRELDYAFVEVNDQWVSQFGYTREESRGKTGTQLGLWADPNDRRKIIEQIEHTGQLSGYDAWVYAKGAREPFLCRISARSVEVAHQRMVLVSQQDITALHRHEQEMMQLNNLLEQRVEERTAALSRTNEDLRTAVHNLEQAQQELLQREKLAALGALVAGIAHELNTPIGNSVTAASTLHDQTQTFTDQLKAGITRSALDRFVDNTRLASDIVLRNLQRAAELVTSFKHVAVDQTSDQRRQFSLDEVVSETLLTLGPGIRKSGHSVIKQMGEDVTMDSYPGALSQIVANLINNAFIHAFGDKEHGTVRVEAGPLGSDEVILVVSDDGCGIAPENIERIFNPFFTTRLGSGGSGLGLHITYNQVTGMLGGQIRAESTPGAGTRFVLTMPRIAPRRSAVKTLEA